MLRDNNVLPTVGSEENPTAVKHVVFWIYFVSIDSEMQPLEIVKVSQLIGDTPLENIGVVFRNCSEYSFSILLNCLNSANRVVQVMGIMRIL